jgi:hypothetical protein
MDQNERPSHDDEANHDSIQHDDDRTSPERDSQDGDDAAQFDASDADVESFLAECERRMRVMFRREFPGLYSTEVDNVLQEVALALVEKSKRQGSRFWDEEDFSLALQIARNKACDILRKRSREEEKRRIKHERMCQSLSQWDCLSAWEREEIITIVAKTADDLTRFQRWLWEQYVEFYPRSMRGDHLAKETGAPFSSKEMKRWIDEIRKRFSSDLRKGGYDLDQLI